MRLRIATLAELGRSDLERWRHLADQAIEPNAFLDPRFLAPGGEPHPEAADARAVLVEHGDELRAFLPIHEAPRNIRGLHTRVVTPAIPFLSYYTPRYYPLVSPDRPSETLEALLRGMRRLRLPDFLDFEGFPGDGPLVDALTDAAAAAGVPMVERGSLDYAYLRRTDEPVPSGAPTAPSPVQLSMEHLGASSRKKYAQHLRQLQRHSGTPLELTDRGDDPAAIEDFLDLQAAGWKGDISRGGAAMRTLGNDRWFTQVAEAFRADGRLSVFTLSGETGTVYIQVALRSGRGLFAAQDAYDETLATFRPGSLGRIAVLRNSMTDTPADFFDPNTHPRYAESSKLYPHRRRYVSYLLAHHGAVAKSVVGAIPALRRVRDRIARPAPSSKGTAITETAP